MLLVTIGVKNYSQFISTNPCYCASSSAASSTQTLMHGTIVCIEFMSDRSLGDWHLLIWRCQPNQGRTLDPEFPPFESKWQRCVATPRPCLHPLSYLIMSYLLGRPFKCNSLLSSRVPIARSVACLSSISILMRRWVMRKDYRKRIGSIFPHTINASDLTFRYEKVTIMRFITYASVCT